MVEGFEGLQGASILEKRRHAQRDYEAQRLALMREPRGHNGTHYGKRKIRRKEEEKEKGEVEKTEKGKRKGEKGMGKRVY